LLGFFVFLLLYLNQSSLIFCANIACQYQTNIDKIFTIFNLQWGDSFISDVTFHKLHGFYEEGAAHQPHTI